MARVIWRSLFEIIPSHAPFCLHRTMAVCSNLHRILYLANIVSRKGKKGPQIWFCGFVSLEFRRMPIDIHLQYFPVKVSDECQVLTQEMRRGTCSRLEGIMQKACSKTINPTKYLRTLTEIVPCQRQLQIRCIELEEYLGAFINEYHRSFRHLG